MKAVKAMTVRPILILLTCYLYFVVTTEFTGGYGTQGFLVHLSAQGRHTVYEALAVQMVYLMLKHTCREH